MMQSQHPPSNNQPNLDDFDEVWVPNPLGRSQESVSPTGLIDILKWDNLESLLTNPWLVSIFVATVIFVVIAAIATTLTSQKNPELTPEQEAQQALLQKSQNLEQTDSNFREYLTRDDNGSGLVSNPGLLQAAILEAGTRYRNRVITSQNNPQNLAYNQHEEVINYNSEIEALKRINLGASGKEAQLKYVDPKTGSWVTIPIDSAELTASGLTKLNIISNSRRGTTQRFDLVTVAQNTRKILSEVKNARLEALKIKGLSPVASELEKTDWFGNKSSPSDAEISDYQQYQPEPIPATPQPSPSSKIGGKNDK
ncbi:hypothetical protein [Calothrix sp. UHCC 0171]|uniref:hypothetical protein n=1 Tax=Calothrix sp. UHCC 0171 TaxID=3110245 RepID=UPI002B1EC8F0|nr:hypothetical protein [Calothrix sp. UHCC 0171]MEA5574770.1 hypothetical protein [Calothrix sp. UHCC 0171]